MQARKAEMTKTVRARYTVAAHRNAWLAKGIAGLLDAPHSGAPRNL
jgi:hypothetical protein